MTMNLNDIQNVTRTIHFGKIHGHQLHGTAKHASEAIKTVFGTVHVHNERCVDTPRINLAGNFAITLKGFGTHRGILFGGFKREFILTTITREGLFVLWSGWTRLEIKETKSAVGKTSHDKTSIGKNFERCT
jgi:hypothetical protein